MSGLETAIRNALARSERANAEVRARIYQSARNALEAGLRKQEINDPETMTAQRHRLEATIHEIEAEERAAVTRAPVREVRVDPVVEAHPQPVLRAERDVRAESTFDTQPRGEVRPAATGDTSDIGAIRPERGDGFAKGAARPAAASATVNEASDFRPERVAKARKRRGRLFSFLLVVATLIAAFGALAWWVENSGLLRDLQNGADDSTPPATVSGEDFAGEDPIKKALDTQSRFSADWRPVFSPGDTAKLSASAAGRFETVSTNEGPAVRVTSTDPDREGAVRIEVSPDVLNEMGGKTSTVALTVQAVGDKPVQVSVECDFSTMGGCGRHRFTVSERTDLLFQVEFDRSLSPSEPGHILLNSDITGKDASVNLYAVRIQPGE
ncbi:biotin transporter BioY [Shinella sp. CPCC 101442]|uniref:biotin transporter BioY n=1 Tax=Shinella sp. CPCC 101442 TaxID=2932265 RepID=UPI002152F684|nr:biotin transporter BioY [Shinella sp. CPCC 101442]MCR6500827.1 biotin transporter BioY [Shinella sp. CPCC 101442]